MLKSLRDAVLLVACVVLLFLQNWRSAVIPLVAVPVAIIGTFGVMAVAGFSLNNLTLFGLVLSIGIVVDDAIVVVEAIAAPRRAGPPAARGDDPGHVAGLRARWSRWAWSSARSSCLCAFVGGITGRFLPAVRPDDRQLDDHLDLQLAEPEPGPGGHPAALARSGDARAAAAGGACRGGRRAGYVLAAALAGGSFLPAVPGGQLAAWAATRLPWVATAAAALAGWFVGRPLESGLAWGFGWFNRGFRASIAMYLRSVRSLLRWTAPALVVYVLLLGLTWWAFRQTPKGFIPVQDMGYLMLNVQLPDSASLERTRQAISRIEKVVLEPHNGVKHALEVVGMSFALNVRSLEYGLDVPDPGRLRGPPGPRALQRGHRQPPSEAAVRGDSRRGRQGLPGAADPGRRPDRRLQDHGRRPRRRGRPRTPPGTTQTNWSRPAITPSAPAPKSRNWSA